MLFQFLGNPAVYSRMRLNWGCLASSIMSDNHEEILANFQVTYGGVPIFSMFPGILLGLWCDAKFESMLCMMNRQVMFCNNDRHFFCLCSPPSCIDRDFNRCFFLWCQWLFMFFPSQTRFAIADWLVWKTSESSSLSSDQSITAIDDVGEAILHLEECNWDLYVSEHNYY